LKITDLNYNILKIKLFITILLVLIIKIGDAQSWIYVTNAEDGAKIYISTKPVYLPSTIKVWTRTTTGNVTKEDNGIHTNLPDSSTLYFVEFDCQQHQYKIHTTVYFDSKGKIIDYLDLNGSKSPWYTVIPNSVYETVFKTVCELFR
jgi:hypothetical protein